MCARASGASVESRSQVMNDARMSFGGVALPVSFFIMRETSMDQCVLVRQRVVSPKFREKLDGWMLDVGFGFGPGKIKTRGGS